MRTNRQLLLLALLAAASALTATTDAAVVEVSEDSEPPAVVQMSMLVPATRIVKLLGFSWSDCSAAGAWVKVKSASVQPDPISLSGKITVAFSLAVSHAFGDGTPVSASVKMEKKVFGTWLKLPCIDNVGSCSYADVCTAAKPPAQCPPEFQKAKVPCKCPIAAGNYTLPGYSFTVDASKIPKFLESGTYRVSASGNAGSSQVFCVNAELSLN